MRCWLGAPMTVVVDIHPQFNAYRCHSRQKVHVKDFAGITVGVPEDVEHNFSAVVPHLSQKSGVFFEPSGCSSEARRKFAIASRRNVERTIAIPVITL